MKAQGGTNSEGRRLIEAQRIRDNAEGVDTNGPPLSAQIDRIRRFYEPLLEIRYDNPQARMRDIEQLQHIAERYRSRSRFVTELTLDPPDSTADLAREPLLDEEYLILSTIHSAKGCEWDVVFIIHAIDGMIPSDMALADEEGLEEERRLFYVAMTRAKDHLHVCYPNRCYTSRQPYADRYGLAQLTRFVTSSVRELLESKTTPAAIAERRPIAGPTNVRQVDLGTRKLWRE